MKNDRLLVIALLLLGFWILPIGVSGQNAGSEFGINPDMSLNVAVEKTSYIQWEPITLHARFENRTDRPLSSLVPSLISEGAIVVESGMEKRQFNELSIFRSMLARQPVTFSPGQGIDEEFTLERALDEFFPKPGTYSIRIVLNGTDGRKIVSNPVEIIIDGATGIDKEALEFIKRNKIHSRYPMLFTWNTDIKNEDGMTLLEAFVSKYSSSVYGETAIYQLGNYYFRKEEYERAQAELEKLKFSRNPRIAKIASDTLLDVNKNIHIKEKDKLH